MIEWSPDDVAAAAGARLVASPQTQRGPAGAVIDSRQAGSQQLFVGLRGEHEDGGRYAAQALANGAWGVLVHPEYAEEAKRASAGAVIAAEDPLGALQRLATAWRRQLNAAVIGITGSTGKTSTKDILKAVLAPHRRTVASRANYNTEIGLPLEILDAPAGTEVLVLEMGMRGPGQIAELAAIAEPDVGVIVSIGPVHLEMLGSIEAIAAAKAELLTALASSGTAVVPVHDPYLASQLANVRATIVTFGEGGDVALRAQTADAVEIDAAGQLITLTVPFTQAHLRRNLLAAVAAAMAIGVTPSGTVELALSARRGQRIELADGVAVIDDCYNANPMSMRAALEELAATAPGMPAGRRVAVLGDMLELGPAAPEYHEQIGEHAAASGVEVLIAVGPLSTATAAGFDAAALDAESYSVADAQEAAALAVELVEPGDVVLVKASRGVGLELVCDALSDAHAEQPA
jgi:UDP-N-acetylmuramoyl-tripeptide--D-alanyl-D-alanine ligase